MVLRSDVHESLHCDAGSTLRLDWLMESFHRESIGLPEIEAQGVVIAVESFFFSWSLLLLPTLAIRLIYMPSEKHFNVRRAHDVYRSRGWQGRLGSWADLAKGYDIPALSRHV